MSLKLMYITNRVDVAKVAQKAGVDRIWVDLEYIGKEERQAGLDTVKSRHTIADIRKIKPHLTTSELLVRINPIHDKIDDYLGTEAEIEQAIEAGADILMLPMFKNVSDVKRFLLAVNGRVKTILLFETPESISNIEEITSLPGLDEVYVGLNDLHLAYKRKFMFELLADGTIDSIVKVFKKKRLVYGFGGIARIGYGDLPAEFILPEHYRLGSRIVILSRGFCNANRTENISDVEDMFINGIKTLREKEKEVCLYTAEQFEQNHLIVNERVQQIISKK